MTSLRSFAGSARIDSSSTMRSRTSASSCLEVDAAEPGELGQAHLEDVVGLHLAELERCAIRPVAAACRVLAAADEGDDLVDDVERLDPALEDVLAVAGLVAGGTAMRRVMTSTWWST